MDIQTRFTVDLVIFAELTVALNGGTLPHLGPAPDISFLSYH